MSPSEFEKLETGALLRARFSLKRGSGIEAFEGYWLLLEIEDADFGKHYRYRKIQMIAGEDDAYNIGQIFVVYPTTRFISDLELYDP